MLRIGLLGAFSIDNTGDGLLALAARQAILAARPGAEVLVFAPKLQGPASSHDVDDRRGLGFRVIPVDPLGPLVWTEGLDALVIGGGGLVSARREFQPFLLGEAARWGGPPAAWNAVCSEGMPWPGPHLAAVRACCERLAYVSVRNVTTAKLVRASGFGGAVHVVPDLAIGLDLPPVVAAVDAGPRPRIGVCLGALDRRAGPFMRELREGLASLARAGAAVLCFPFGGIYGDVAAARRLARGIPGARFVPAPASPLDAWRFIGSLDACIAGTSPVIGRVTVRAIAAAPAPARAASPRLFAATVSPERVIRGLERTATL